MWLMTLIVGLVVFWVVRFFLRRSRLPPGPVPIPLIGNMMQIDLKTLHKVALHDWRQKYGPVVSVYLGPLLMIVVSDIDLALDVLVKRSTEFASRLQTTSLLMFTEGGKDIALAPYGPTWKLHRKIASKALRQYMLGDKLQERVHLAIEACIPELEKCKEPFNPAEYVNFIVGNILTGLCFGGKYDFDDQDLNKMIKKNDSMVSEFDGLIMEDLFPRLQHVYKTRKFRKLEQLAKEILDDFLRKRYNEEKKTFDRTNCRHLVDSLLLARLEAEEEEGSEALESLTETHLVQTLSDIFFAGIDTSRLTLRFAILHMCAYPEIQKKVHEELDRVVGRDHLPGLADRPNLGYTEAVLHESMRLATISPSGFMHMTSCDTELAGYKIPKGKQVAINHWALHHDPDAWEDVDKFIPERFLDANGKLGPKPRNWLPFSAGTRVCLGEFVAKPKLHLIFASLMQKFTWAIEPGTEADLTPEGNCFQNMPKDHKVVVEKRV